MPVDVVMPKLGLTMEEGLIVEWKVKEGDEVKKGDILFVLETEKVTYDVEAPEDGVLGKIVVQEQETVPVGAVVAYILKSGESVADIPGATAESPKPSTPSAPAASTPPKKPAGKVKLTIIGGGTGGYPAAIRAARLGAEVTLIEKDLLGGVCLNRGCIPTKALLQTANVINTMNNSEVFGVSCKGYNLNFKAAMDRKSAVSKQLCSGVQALLGAKKVKVIKGTATLVDNKTVQIQETGEKITSDAILISTGSKPIVLPIEGIDGPDVLDSTDALAMESLPKSVVIIGGGVISCEFAQVLRTFGSDVTILELMPAILPGIDTAISSTLHKSLEAAGVKIFNNANVKKIVNKKKGENVVTYEVDGKEQTCKADKILATVGRKPALDALNLDKIGIACEKGAIVVNEYMETNVPGVFAAGDIVGGIMLAHLATAEAECAAKNIVGEVSKMNYRVVPACIYTDPEIASVGLSEEEAKKVADIKVGTFPFRGNGKAMVLNETEGMVKVIADKKYGEILGVHIIGPHATDMISEAVLGMTIEMTAEELAHAIHPHPTLTEAIMEAGQILAGGCIHMP
jgi:dihydrolipoamide dehydrogenase